MRKSLLAVSFLPFLLVGCASTNSDPDVVGATQVESESLISTLAIKYATLRVIEESEEPASVATRVEEIALDAKGMVELGSVSVVAELEERIRERINWANMEPTQRLLADALLVTIRSEIENRIGSGALSPYQKVVVSQALDHVISAARLF